MAVDISDKAHRRHMQIVAIYLANLTDDLEMVNTDRAEWHMATNMQGGPPSKEEMDAANADFYVMWN